MDKQRAEMWEKAYDFAYPLVAFQKYVDYITNTEVATETKAPINQFFHTRRVLLPEDHFPRFFGPQSGAVSDHEASD